MATNLRASTEQLLVDSGGEGSFRRYVVKIRPEINEHIEALFSTYGWENETCSGLRDLMSGGKRLRAGLALLTFDAFALDGSGRDTALDLAGAVEIAHSASLILDDMLDGDEVRRGRKAVHVSKGQKKALLEMTGLLSVPYSIVNVHGSRFTECLASTHRAVVEGELAQVDASGKECTLERYERIISLKTGQMFALAARFGAMAADRSDPLIKQLATFGLSVGTIMQVADDITDLGKVTEERAISGHGSELLLWRGLDRLPAGPGVPPRSTDAEKKARMMELLNDHIGRGEDALPTNLSRRLRTRPGAEHLLACLRRAPREIAEIAMDAP